MQELSLQLSNWHIQWWQ